MAPSLLECSTPARSFQKQRTTFINMNTVVKRMEMMLIDLIQFVMAKSNCFWHYYHIIWVPPHPKHQRLRNLQRLIEGKERNSITNVLINPLLRTTGISIFLGEDIKLLISGLLKFASALCQIFQFVFQSTWNVSDTDFIAPNITFNSTSPGTTIKRRA